MHLCWHSSSLFTACAVVKIMGASVSQLMADHTGLCYTKVPGLIANVPPPTVVQELHYPRGVGDWGGPWTPQPNRTVTGLTWTVQILEQWMVCGQMDSLQQRTEYRCATQRNQQAHEQQSVLHHDFLVADANNKGWAGTVRNWNL